MEDIWWGKSHLTREQIKAIIEEKGKDWMIAAMIEGSIGYHTAISASRCIEWFKAGNDTDWCERCDACFGRNLLKMMTYDIYHWMKLEEMDGERYQRILRNTQIMMNADEETQWSISMLYPTM